MKNLVDAARGGEPTWDEARAARVLAGARRRFRRAQAVRRTFILASGLAAVIFVMLRAASAPAADGPRELAAQDSGDGGYGRD